MAITYYVDMIFIFNLIMDYTLLSLIHPKQGINRFRLFAAACVGAAAVVVMLGISMIPVWSFMLLRLFFAGLMAWIGIPHKGLGEFLCNMALLYGTSAAIYGICFIFCVNKDIQNEMIAYFFPIGAASILFLGKRLYCFRENRKHRDQYRFEVMLYYNGKTVNGRAFYDSGNHLYEPISGWPVILVKEELLNSLCLEPEKRRAVPYKAVGSTAGLLYAYPMEKLIIHYGGENKTWINFYATAVPEELLKQEECDVILHVSFV